MPPIAERNRTIGVLSSKLAFFYLTSMPKIVAKKSNKEYKNLLNKISDTFESGRDTAIQAVNSALVETYWQVGRHIVEFEQKGKNKAVYGENLLRALAKDLSAKLGKGFSMPNLYYMRLFYQRFPIFQTLSGKLSNSQAHPKDFYIHTRSRAMRNLLNVLASGARSLSFAPTMEMPK